MRNYSIDFLRFIAVAFVIVIHVAPYSRTVLGDILNQTARFAVPFFFVVSGYFFYQRTTAKDRNVWGLLFTYGLRLLYIYLFWYGVYALWPLLSPQNWGHIAEKGIAAEIGKWASGFLAEFRGHLLYYLAAGGRGYHLWFLPSLGMAIGLLTLSIRFRLFVPGLLLSLVFFTLALMVAPYRDMFSGLSFGFDPRNGPFFSSLFVFLGAALAKYEVKTSLRTALIVFLGGYALHLLEVFLIQWVYGVPRASHDFVIGTVPFAVGLALVALADAQMGMKWNAYKLGQLSLGIYVSHVLIIWIFAAMDIWPASDLLKFLGVFAVSVALVAGMQRIPLLSKVVE